jgi:hypothetical protein
MSVFVIDLNGAKENGEGVDVSSRWNVEAEPGIGPVIT